MKTWLKNSYKSPEEEYHYFVGGKSGPVDLVYPCDMKGNYKWVSEGKYGNSTLVSEVIESPWITELHDASPKNCCVVVHGMHDIWAVECVKYRFVCEVADVV